MMVLMFIRYVLNHVYLRDHNLLYPLSLSEYRRVICYQLESLDLDVYVATSIRM